MQSSSQRRRRAKFWDLKRQVDRISHLMALAKWVIDGYTFNFAPMAHVFGE